MKKIVEFMNDCDAFFVITNNGKFPSARPFKAIMENDGKLYICTNNKKKVFKQIMKDNNLHIIAIRRSTRNWIRFDAIASLINDQNVKNIFFTKYPRLSIIYKTPSNPNFEVFSLELSNLEEYKE